MTVLFTACQTAPIDRSSIPVTVSEEKPDELLSYDNAGERVVSNVQTEETAEVQTVVPINSVWQRVRLGLQLTEHYSHPAVERQLANYEGNQRFFDLVAERASPFLYSIVEEISERGLPMEVALLPMVESTFNPNAYSRERAVGLWQFLGPTGREFGLQQDWWYDGRRDPENSTRAALDYLEQLYNQFDQDWLLALAAYNTGGANLNRALRRSGSAEVSFWELPLAAETRSHIPKVLALSQIIISPDDFGIELPDIPNHNPLAKLDVGSQIDLAKVAELVGLPLEHIKSLNPGYLQWATHPEDPQTITVPFGVAEMLEQGLTDLDSSQYVTWEHYRIRNGDTLGAIARRLNTTVDVLQVVNQLSGTQIIAGRSLLIPRGIGAANYTSLTAPVPRNQPVTVPTTYRVRAGDNLWSIARRFDLRSQEIADHNGLALSSLLHPGQVLDLSYSPSVQLVSGDTVSPVDSNIYSVRRGDSMEKIADRVGADLDDLLRWNDLNRRDLIFPGQQLIITAP